MFIVTDFSDKNLKLQKTKVQFKTYNDWKKQKQTQTKQTNKNRKNKKTKTLNEILKYATALEIPVIIVKSFKNIINM